MSSGCGARCGSWTPGDFPRPLFVFEARWPSFQFCDAEAAFRFAVADTLHAATSSPSSSEIPGKMVRAVDGRDGTVWGVQVQGELLAYRAAKDQDPSKMKVHRRNLDCRELNELGELTCCRVLGDGRGLLGSAGGTLAVVDVEGAAPDDGVGADGGAMEGRCAVAVAVDLRCGAISSVLPGTLPQCRTSGPHPPLNALTRGTKTRWWLRSRVGVPRRSNGNARDSIQRKGRGGGKEQKPTS